MTTASDIGYVLRTVAERDVRHVRLWFVDVMGALKSVSIPANQLDQALTDGVSIDGSSLEGTRRLREVDAIVMPDPRSFQILPWSTDETVGRMFCDVCLHNGARWAGDSRGALRSMLGKIGDRGWTFQVGSEIEFFLFAPLSPDAIPPRPLDHGGYFDLTPRDVGTAFRRGTIGHSGPRIAPRSRAISVRDPARRRRRAGDGRRDHDLQGGRQGSR